MTQRFLILILSITMLFSCKNQDKDESIFIPKDIVIAHRGTTYWAPEETESAYRWARDIGAHYLEVDIQRSKDGVLLALHDDQLTRTTNISDVYSSKDSLASSEFTFEELLKLDAGGWFNISNPERAKPEFSGSALVYKAETAFYFDSVGNKLESELEEVYFGGMQQILALEDVIRIAEGYRIAKDVHGNRLYKKLKMDGQIKYRFYYVEDQEDSGHRPGIYIETKEPHLFPGVEKDLFVELNRLGWNQLTKPATDNQVLIHSRVNIANTSAKVILQTFSPNSLMEINKYFQSKIPTTFLLWLGDPNMPKEDKSTYIENLEFAKKYGAHIIGPSIGGQPNNYADLLKEMQYEWIRNQGFLIHPYSFDTEKQTHQYGKYCDGMFTNRADLTLKYYAKK